MLAKLNHINSDTPTDIGRTVAYKIEQLEEEINLNKTKADYDMDETKSKLAYLNLILNAANTLIYYVNSEFTESKSQ